MWGPPRKLGQWIEIHDGKPFVVTRIHQDLIYEPEEDLDEPEEMPLSCWNCNAIVDFIDDDDWCCHLCGQQGVL